MQSRTLGACTLGNGDADREDNHAEARIELAARTAAATIDVASGAGSRTLAVTLTCEVVANGVLLFKDCSRAGDQSLCCHAVGAVEMIDNPFGNAMARDAQH